MKILVIVGVLLAMVLFHVMSINDELVGEEKEEDFHAHLTINNEVSNYIMNDSLHIIHGAFNTNVYNSNE